MITWRLSQRHQHSTSSISASTERSRKRQRCRAVVESDGPSIPPLHYSLEGKGQSTPLHFCLEGKGAHNWFISSHGAGPRKATICFTPVCPSAYTHPSVHLPTHPSVHLPTHQSVRMPTYPFLRCPSIRLPDSPNFHQSTILLYLVEILMTERISFF